MDKNSFYGRTLASFWSILGEITDTDLFGQGSDEDCKRILERMKNELFDKGETETEKVYALGLFDTLTDVFYMIEEKQRESKKTV